MFLLSHRLSAYLTPGCHSSLWRRPFARDDTGMLRRWGQLPVSRAYLSVWPGSLAPSEGESDLSVALLGASCAASWRRHPAAGWRQPPLCSAWENFSGINALQVNKVFLSYLKPSSVLRVSLMVPNFFPPINFARYKLTTNHYSPHSFLGLNCFTFQVIGLLLAETA